MKKEQAKVRSFFHSTTKKPKTYQHNLFRWRFEIEKLFFEHHIKQ